MRTCPGVDCEEELRSYAWVQLPKLSLACHKYWE